MSAPLILALVGAYFLILILIARLTGKEDDNASFFLGRRQSPWYVVAFGMVGASLSGVTFISVPGWVAESQFSYMQVVLGYLVGYAVIIKVLLPVYYRLQLTSIYTYLEQRFGPQSYRTGAAFFLLSRVIGAAFRLYLVAVVLQFAVFDQLGLPFAATVAITILLIWVYTFRSGIRTIIWTDTLQTAFMLAAVVIAVVLLKQQLMPDIGLWQYIADSPRSQIFFWEDWGDSRHFSKQFISGIFITIAMTGLDQDMMQKNLSCRSLADAQKNMFWLAISLVVVNLIFLSLGVLLHDYAAQESLAFAKADELFAAVALSGQLGSALAVFFIIGLIAAAYSSADSALTALTTSFCVDFLGIEKREARQARSTRKKVHFGFSLLLFAVIIVFRQLNDQSVIAELFTAAGYTYGPLLGLFAFGLLTRQKIHDARVLPVALLAPLLSWYIKSNTEAWFGYSMSFEHLLVNAMLTFLGLLAIRRPKGSS